MSTKETAAVEIQEAVDFTPELKALVSMANSLPFFSPVKKALVPLIARQVAEELPHVVYSAFRKGLHD